MAQRVGKDDFEEKVLKAAKPVLVDFYSDSCIPCKRMSGVLGDIEDEYGERLDVVKVNVNFEPELAEEYRVMSAPTLLLIKDGTEVARKRGAAGKEEITALFEGIL